MPPIYTSHCSSVAKNILNVDTSQSAIMSTIGVMILAMFALLFSHILGDIASGDAGEREADAPVLLVLPPTEQLQGQWVVTTSDACDNNTNFVLIFNDILFFLPRGWNAGTMSTIVS